MASPKAHNLFHFTKTIEALHGILKSGFFPRYCLEDISWVTDERAHMAYPMVCFCDIPLTRITDHTDFYGSFGLGLTKDWGFKNALHPIAYLPENGSFCKLGQQAIIKGVENIFKEEQREEFASYLYRQIALMKPISGTMVINGEFVPKDFHQECEWRYVPEGTYINTREELEKDRDALNEKLEHFKLQITPQDIRYIFVKNDSNIPSVYDFINAELGHFPLSDIKILISRVTSLETLNRDL